MMNITPDDFYRLVNTVTRMNSPVAELPAR